MEFIADSWTSSRNSRSAKAAFDASDDDLQRAAGLARHARIELLSSRLRDYVVKAGGRVSDERVAVPGACRSGTAPIQCEAVTIDPRLNYYWHGIDTNFVWRGPFGIRRVPDPADHRHAVRRRLLAAPP